MIGQEVVKSLITKEDFKKATYVYNLIWSDTLSTTANTASYDDINKYAVINSSAGTGGYLSIYFDDIRKGDVVEAEVLIKRAIAPNYETDIASIGTQHVNNETVNNTALWTGGVTTTTSDWETLVFKNVCMEDRRLRVDFGMYPAQSGTFYIKYAVAKITKKNTENNIRKIAIRQNRLNSPARWEVVEGDGCTFVVDSSAKTLKVIYSKPFKEGHNPIVIVQPEYTNDSDLISVSISASSKDSVLIKFRNSTGVFIDPNTALLSTGNYYMKIASFGDFT